MLAAMPPSRAAPLTSSFSVSDENNVVVCPLRNHDSSACRKRCTGEKRFRSMQEHIRRAHPEHYISKLPATEESFMLMVNTPPQERPPPPPTTTVPASTVAAPQTYDYSANEHNSFFEPDFGSHHVPSSSDGMRRPSLLPAATAAAALASLHHHRAEYDWDSDPDAASDQDSKNFRPRARFAPTPIDQHRNAEEPYYTSNSIQQELLPSSLARSPPGRSSTLPPGAHSLKPNRPRKSSVGQHARRAKHERQRSREFNRRLSYERKAYSAEPATAAAIMGKRWEDLIDAAASATEEDSRDLTPVPQSPTHSPRMIHSRTSLPPFNFASQLQSYTASPLNNSLTPPPPDMSDLQPFPSVESSIESAMSGQNFHMPSQGLSDSSPSSLFPVQIYCAACRKLSILRDSYACSECICGLCQECVDVLVSEHNRGRAPTCPRCNTIGAKFKPFQLDIR
ncbi:transcription factor [Pyrenophora seminiperda CCB06]|uniref:Transcription factor n=1 Tax=Pyrenophora seminiperda CCB06 TaxID=1302712 RepID=A0A3M7M7T7_9PLEO|nr:transcription factor [Pyrenophora seminiperda CCB06]